MPNWTVSARTSESVALLLYPGFSNHCLANAVEPLRAANEFLGRNYYDWSFASLEGDKVISSSGLPVMPERHISDHQGGDHLCVLAGYDVQSYAHHKTARALQSASRRFAHIIGMDTAPWLLARAGLLDGKAATIHPLERVRFSEAFTDVRVVADRYVVDGHIMTCSGATTAFELVLHLIARSHGEALKLDVSSMFLDASLDPGAAGVPIKTRSPKLAQVLAQMSDNIENPLPIAIFAQAVEMSQRNLARLFQQELGATPQQVYRHLRLSTAREYLQHSPFSVSEIALRCGYKNASAMTRAYVAEFGVTPSQTQSSRRSDMPRR
ncbi:GlxA family transcriptional regulator [Yoonia sp. BS5-3]|uniref:GlxA family transcriptional regulator n=1 Tax=Yoonia phaeophyticola TaxID=3137369 RepID=A0ABZ2V861_9RHOB